MDRELRTAIRAVKASGRTFEFIACLIEESEELELEVRNYLKRRGGKHVWGYIPEKMITVCYYCKKVVTDAELHSMLADFVSTERLLLKQGVCPGRSQDV